MKSMSKKYVGWLLVAVLVAGLLALVGPSVTEDQLAQANSPRGDGPTWSINAKNGNPGVLPPNSNAFGKTYGEWSAAFWEWAYSLPATPDHPLIADGAMDCSLGQSGKVWFLGGTYTANPDPNDPRIVVGTADRECTVPTGKALFFPIINAECDTIDEGDVGDGMPEEDLRNCANDLIDAVKPDNLSATIDGVPVANLADYRADLPLFPIESLPDPNLKGVPPGEYGDAVADGYYLMLPPLSAGEHEIDFIGKVEIFDGDDLQFSFTLDIEYDLTVVPGAK